MHLAVCFAALLLALLLVSLVQPHPQGVKRSEKSNGYSPPSAKQALSLNSAQWQPCWICHHRGKEHLAELAYPHVSTKTFSSKAQFVCIRGLLQR
jgi:hypothetical protein